MILYDVSCYGEPMELAIVSVANSQQGVIGRRQVLALGFSERQVERRLQRGALQHLARGVYALRGSTPTWERSVVASWVATLERRHPGALALRTAGALHGFAGLPRSGSPQLVVADAGRHSNPFGSVMRRRDLEPDDIDRHHLGVLITNPVRTALDLAMEDGRTGRPERVIDDALAHGKVTIDALWDRFQRMADRGKPGTVHVRRILLDRLPSAQNHPSAQHRPPGLVLARARAGSPEAVRLR